MNQRLVTIVGSSLLVLAVGLAVYWFGGQPAPQPAPPGPKPPAKDSPTKDGTPSSNAAWIERIAASDPAVRRSALAELDQHKDEAGKAVPVLLAHLDEKDPATRSALTDALASLGKDDGPAGKEAAQSVRNGLVAALGKDDPATQAVAALALAKLDLKDARAVIPLLDKAVATEDRTLRYVAALALRRLAELGGGEPAGSNDRTFAGRWLRIAHARAVNSEDTAVVGTLVDALGDPDPALQRWTAEFFAELGHTIRTSPEAIPALTEVFKGRDEEAARAAARALGRLSLRESSVAGTLLATLGDGNVAHRRRAAEALASANLSLDPLSTRVQVPAALQTPEAVAALARAVKDSDPAVRDQAIRTLAAIGAPAAGAVPALVEVAASAERPERLAVFKALGAIAQDSATVVPLLLKALKENDEAIRKEAGLALAAYGKEAVPGLRAALADKEIRRGALQALGVVGPEAREAVADLTPLLKSEAPDERVLAAAALLQIDPTSKDALPVLKEALTADEAPIRHAALDALKTLGPVAAGLTPELARALDHEDKGTAWRAADALAAIGPAAREAVPALAAAIKRAPDTKRKQERVFLDSDEYICQRAIEALRAIGIEANKAAAEALVAVLKVGPDLEAADALSLLDPSHAAGLDALVEAAQSPFDNIREVALRALSRLGATAAPAVPRLVERLAGDNSLNSPLKGALVRLGPVAVPALVKALDDASLRRHAIEVLGQIGPAAREAAPALLKAADGDTLDAALLALASLGEAGVAPLVQAIKDEARPAAPLLRTLATLGPAAKSAVPTVKELLTAPSEEVQAAAALALVEIGGDAKAAGTVLVRLLKEGKNHDARRDAARGVGSVPAEAEAAVPLLQEMLAKDPAFDLREAAAESLGALGKEAAVTTLIEALGDRFPPVQEAVCKALVRFGATKEIVAALQARLKERGPGLVAVLDALGRLGPEAKAVVPALRELLQAPEEGGPQPVEQTTAAARALWRIEGKPAAREVVAILRRQLTVPTYSKALADTIAAIGELGPEGRALVPLLMPHLDGVAQDVRRASAEALGKIGPAAKLALPWLQRAATQEADEVLRRKAKDAVTAIQKS